MDNVSVTFGGLTVLDDVSLAVRPGQIVGVIGPNGAGKTTLFNVVCGFTRPQSGTLTFDGKVLSRHRPHHLPSLGMARTLQGVGLWSGLTVLEQVMTGAHAQLDSGLVASLLGLWRSSREESRLRSQAHDVLAKLGVANYEDALPGSLPYGIQKRVALARALMAEPKLLLLDEPASGLSGAEMDELGARLVSLKASTSVLLVEHHMDLVMSICDHIVVLNFGEVIAQGTPDQIRTDPQVTTAYLGEEVEASSTESRLATGPAGV